MNAQRGWGVALVALFFLGIVALSGYALAQMGPGMMGGQQRPQGEAPGGPGGTMGPGMMGPGGMMGGGMMGAVATNDRPWITVMLDRREDLGLSAEQVGRLFMLRDRFAKDAQAKSEALAKAEQSLAEMLGPEPVDLAKAEAVLKQIEVQRTDLRMSRLRVIEEGKRVLTPEQRKKLVELVKAEQPSSRGPAAEGSMMGNQGSGIEEMHRFMQSDRAPQAMAAMMEMARQMGNGDVRLGMVRMMEMMGGMGQMMGQGW
jgi:Spy/CpxP family protein refolding chaperone